MDSMGAMLTKLGNHMGNSRGIPPRTSLPPPWVVGRRRVPTVAPRSVVGRPIPVPVVGREEPPARSPTKYPSGPLPRR